MSACCFLVLSCTSLKEPKNVFSDIDYTNEDVRKEEIKRIHELIDKNQNPVQALWRASLLNDSDTLKTCYDAVVKSYDSYIENEDFFDARRIFSSLKVLNYSDLGSLSKSENELEKKVSEKLPGFQKTSSGGPKKVSEFISGTVTIWVDKGIKIENGMGYADRVIGSGFFISKSGYLITNHHVIADVVDPKNEGYTRLYIKLADDSENRIPAKVIGWDSDIDLALVKAEVEPKYVFSLGSSEDLDVGDKIYAIGSPIGLERTLTGRIVSATDRKLFSLGNVMQIDAAVNSGNSGGPCIDENGNVQAIVFAGILDYSGLNFAIPVEYLKSVLPALYAGGKVNHPWLGCFGHTKKDAGKDVGVEVQYVFPGSSASRAHIKIGDVIVEVDGTKITTFEDLQSAMMKKSAKSIIEIKYARGEEEPQKVAVYLAVRPENPGYNIYSGDIIANSFLPIFGMKLIPVSTSSNKKYSIEYVLKGSVADESGFSESDPIQIRDIQFDDDKTAMFVSFDTKNRKKGYLDISMVLSASLNSPYYF